VAFLRVRAALRRLSALPAFAIARIARGFAVTFLENLGRLLFMVLKKRRSLLRDRAEQRPRGGGQWFAADEVRSSTRSRR
jgi:hypothetical protein